MVPSPTRIQLPTCNRKTLQKPTNHFVSSLSHRTNHAQPIVPNVSNYPLAVTPTPKSRKYTRLKTDLRIKWWRCAGDIMPSRQGPDVCLLSCRIVFCVIVIGVRFRSQEGISHSASVAVSSKARQSIHRFHSNSRSSKPRQRRGASSCKGMGLILHHSGSSQMGSFSLRIALLCLCLIVYLFIYTHIGIYDL